MKIGYRYRVHGRRSDFPTLQTAPQELVGATGVAVVPLWHTFYYGTGLLRLDTPVMIDGTRVENVWLSNEMVDEVAP